MYCEKEWKDYIHREDPIVLDEKDKTKGVKTGFNPTPLEDKNPSEFFRKNKRKRGKK